MSSRPTDVEHSTFPTRPGVITVVLADDNLLVREGARALIGIEPDLEVVGTAGDFDELVATAEATRPQVVVTDIRMPPNFEDEGIEAAKLVRKRYPGTGIVVLSQYDEPDYAIALLSEGAAGYAYLLKDRVADGNRLARAIREVAIGGSMLDPEIAAALTSPIQDDADLSPEEQSLLDELAAGRPIKAIAASRGSSAQAVQEATEALFMKLSRDADDYMAVALRRLRTLQQAMTEREEPVESLSRLLPSGLADVLRNDPEALASPQRLDVTVLMSDVRGYSAIAEHTDPTVLAGQLNDHRREMNAAVHEQGGTVMQYIGDAVMAVFGAPLPQKDHARRAVRAAEAMHARQRALDEAWRDRGLAPFGLGIGLSTGEVAAAVLGSEDRVEYTVVGDTVNLAQRLQDLARPAGTTVISEPTRARAAAIVRCESLGNCQIKGRQAPVVAHRLVAIVEEWKDTPVVGVRAGGSTRP